MCKKKSDEGIAVDDEPRTPQPGGEAVAQSSCIIACVHTMSMYSDTSSVKEVVEYRSAFCMSLQLREGAGVTRVSAKAGKSVANSRPDARNHLPKDE